MQYAKTVREIDGAFANRRVEDIALDDVNLVEIAGVAACSRDSLGCAVDGEYFGAIARGEVAVSPKAAPRI
jgi:hypothetical protein